MTSQTRQKRFLFFVCLGTLLGVMGYVLFIQIARTNNQQKYMPNATPDQNAELKSQLPSDVYRVMYEGGTEPPFSSPLNIEKRNGTFVTADTKLPVYRSEDKYDSGTGWPSFTKPIEGSIVLREDKSLFSVRTEVVSSDTGAHLGHVFDDGPSDRGGKRYCMNGVALLFIPDEVQ